jgi:hypothetical protein
MDKILEELYYNDFSGFEKFYKKAKKENPTLSKSDVKKWYEKQEITQRAKKVVVKKDSMFKINAPELSFQIDIMHINKALKSNTSEDFYYFLLVVDILSRKAFVYPLQNMTSSNIIDAYILFLKDVHNLVEKLDNTYDAYSRNIPLSITGDKQFDFKQFNDLNHEIGIRINTQTAKEDHISHGNRLGIIDRLTRTIKGYLTKIVHSKKSNNFGIKDIISAIVETYNETENKGIQEQTPDEAFNSSDIRTVIFKSAQKHNEKITSQQTLKVGDRVRIYETKDKFDKEKLTFSKSIHQITEIIGNKYKVSNNERLFKPHELLKIDQVENAPENDISIEIKKK